MKKLAFVPIGCAIFLFACKKISPVSEPAPQGDEPFLSRTQLNGIVNGNDSAFAVSTYAGSGVAGYSNGSPGSLQTAQFDAPEGVVFDSNGNMFVADRDNHVIRKITTGGTVSLFAGQQGVFGAANGTGTAAQFHSPIRLSIDASDNLYVADRDNARIRKISPAGVVTTIAGSTAGSGSTQFNWPVDVAASADGSKIYVADSKNHRIQKITLSGTTYTTSLLAGGSTTGSYLNGTGASARFSFPSGVDIDNAGNVIVADRYNHCIRKVTASGVASLLAGKPARDYDLDAPALQASFGEPYGVTVANDGCIYVADIEYHNIRRLSTQSFVATVAGRDTAGYADGSFNTLFNIPTAVAIDANGNFYVADIGNNRIRKLSPENRVLQYTEGWDPTTPFAGVTRYRFHGNRFFIPSEDTNRIQNVNVLDIDMSLNHLDFKTVAFDTTVTGIIGTTTTAVAALSGTFATTQYGPPDGARYPVSYVRSNNVTYWSTNIYKTGTNYWVYHDGYFYIDNDGTIGMAKSDMSQDPFNPGSHKYITSGAPLLIQNNDPVELTHPEPSWATPKPQIIRTIIAARSVIAIPVINNHVLLICIDGAEPDGAVNCAPVSGAYGMTTGDVAQFMRQYFNASWALNLDGGGSASMCLKGAGDNGGMAGGLGVISYPSWQAASLQDCPAAHTAYANQRNYMRDAIAVIPN